MEVSLISRMLLTQENIFAIFEAQRETEMKHVKFL